MPIPGANLNGDWGPVISWPIIGIHATLTPDGKVFSFGTDQAGLQGAEYVHDVWDPVTNTHVTLTEHIHTDIFCSVPLIVPETGQILIAGGDDRPNGHINHGVADVNVFDYRDLSIDPSPDGPMNFARWYPTMLTLANGQLLILGGRDNDNNYIGYPEIYTPGDGWRTLVNAYMPQIDATSNYPRAWVASSGKIYAFTSDVNPAEIYEIDPAGQGSVNVVGQLPFSASWTQPAVMYETDKALLIAANGTAWIMDMSGATPTFTQTASLGNDRKWSNLISLADGTVIASGGSATPNALNGVNNTVAIWDPDTGLWSQGDAASLARLYHSTSLLLPDATVLALGGGAPGPLNNLNGEIYRPAYLFDDAGNLATRPVITGAPDVLNTGDTFSMTVGDPASIQKLTLVAFGATTHSFAMANRKFDLDFTVQANGSLSVTLPDNANNLTPGYWMLFAFDNQGTPSVAETIKINPDGQYYVPPIQPFDVGLELLPHAEALYDGWTDSYLLSPDRLHKHGAVTSELRLDLTQSFDFRIELMFGDDDGGGDGMAFVLHNDPLGAEGHGGTGAQLGATGIVNGIGIEFDVNPNGVSSYEPAADHTSFFDTDILTGNATVAPVVSLPNLENGQWHDVRVTWNGSNTLTYWIDGVQRGSLTGNLATNYLGGSNFAHFAITGATSAASNPFNVRFNDLIATLEGGATLNSNRSGGGTAPAAVNDSYTVSAGGTLSVAAAIGVLANDTDPDTPVSQLTAAVAAGPAHGTLTLSANGSFIYTPVAGYSGADSFTYRVSDGTSSSAPATVALTVTSSNANPVITSNGGAATAAIAVAESSTAVTTVTATDANAGQTPSYSISGGADAAMFAIDGATGVLTFVIAPNYEAPADAGLNNVYDVFVQVADGAGGADSQAIAITVTDVAEGSGGTISGTPGNDILAGTAGPDIILGLAGNDRLDGLAGDDQLDGGVGNDNLFGGAGVDQLLGGDGVDYLAGDAGDDRLNGGAGNDRMFGGAGADMFIFQPGFGADIIVDYKEEDRLDVGALGITGLGALTLTASGANTIVTIGANSITLERTAVAAMDAGDFIFVSGAGNEPPIITSNGGGAAATISIPENSSAVTTVTASDPNAGQTLSYSITGGADAARFSISAQTGALAFLASPNYEAPTDAGANNIYDVFVQVSDGATGVDAQSIAVTVTNVAEPPSNQPPVITSNGGGATAAIALPENGTAVTTVTATDPDAGQTLSYAIGGGVDAARFSINTTTGALGFLASPNYEAPTDAGANNIYDVMVQVADGAGGLDSQAISVTITDVAEGGGGTITGTPGNDTLSGTGGPDVMQGLAGNDRLDGLAGDDQLDGGVGNDSLFGGIGSDRLLGGDGIDYLAGDEGVDFLTGGAGSDRLFGGAGIDTFIYGPGAGADIIVDYKEEDILDVSALGITGFAGLTLSASGTSTIVSLGANGSITLERTTVASMDAGDFDFA